MSAVVFLALGRSEEVGAHVRTPLVTSKLPTRVAAVGRGIALLAAALVVLWLAWAAWQRGLVSFEHREETPGMTGVPVWPVRLMIPVGAVLLALELGFGAVRSFAGRHETDLRDHEDLMPLEGTSL
jgi:TRAP-type mannitol/chloroaromatic compound transport system permease small subunit